MNATPVSVTTPTAREPELQVQNGQRTLQTRALPTDEAFLEEFLTYVFATYWDQIVFGPIIEGAGYELTCPCKPERIRKFDGYLTVTFRRAALSLVHR